MTEQFKVGDECNIRCEVVSVAKDGMEVRPTSSKDALIFCFSDGRFDRKDPIPSLFKRKFKRRVDKVDVEQEARKALEKGPVRPLGSKNSYLEGFRDACEMLRGPAQRERAWTIEEIKKGVRSAAAKNDVEVEEEDLKEVIAELLAQKPSEPKPEPVKQERVWTFGQITQVINSLPVSPDTRFVATNLFLNQPLDTPPYQGQKPEPVKPERKLKWKAWRSYDEDNCGAVFLFAPSPSDYEAEQLNFERVPQLDVYEEGGGK